jgi:predicted nucleotidyltransferase
VYRTGRKDNLYSRKARQEVKRLASKLRESFHPSKLLLFGSVARGDVHALSDIGLVIIADFSGSRRDRVEQILNLAEKLDLIFPIEPIPLRPEESLRNRPFFKHLSREAIEL